MFLFQRSNVNQINSGIFGWLSPIDILGHIYNMEGNLSPAERVFLNVYLLITRIQQNMSKLHASNLEFSSPIYSKFAVEWNWNS